MDQGAIYTAIIATLAAVGAFLIKVAFPNLLEAKKTREEREWKERETIIRSLQKSYNDMLIYERGDLRDDLKEIMTLLQLVLKNQEQKEMMEMLRRMYNEIEQIKTSARAIMGILSKED